MDLVPPHCFGKQGKALLSLKEEAKETLPIGLRARGRLRSPMGKSSLVLSLEKEHASFSSWLGKSGWQVRNSL